MKLLKYLNLDNSLDFLESKKRVGLTRFNCFIKSSLLCRSVQKFSSSGWKHIGLSTTSNCILLFVRILTNLCKILAGLEGFAVRDLGGWEICVPNGLGRLLKAVSIFQKMVSLIMKQKTKHKEYVWPAANWHTLIFII